jgi:hypothetical protein
LPEASIVENGTRVLTRMFGSMVGTGVSVGGGTVTVGVAVSTGIPTVAVGVHGIGWNGVGVGEAFGAAVTSAKGRVGCGLVDADAKVPHPASRTPARSTRWTHLFIC